MQKESEEKIVSGPRSGPREERHRSAKDGLNDERQLERELGRHERDERAYRAQHTTWKTCGGAATQLYEFTLTKSKNAHARPGRCKMFAEQTDPKKANYNVTVIADDRRSIIVNGIAIFVMRGARRFAEARYLELEIWPRGPQLLRGKAATGALVAACPS